MRGASYASAARLGAARVPSARPLPPDRTGQPGGPVRGNRAACQALHGRLGAAALHVAGVSFRARSPWWSARYLPQVARSAMLIWSVLLSFGIDAIIIVCLQNHSI